jgi:hypothetical protein
MKDLIQFLTFYLCQVFISRQLNKTLYKIDKNYPIWVASWFCGFGWIAFLILIVHEKTIRTKVKKNWFNGKNW